MATESPETVSDLIRAAITRTGRTQKWVRTQAGFAESTWERKIRGHVDWKIGELADVANVLGVHVSELLPPAWLDVSERVA